MKRSKQRALFEFDVIPLLLVVPMSNVAISDEMALAVRH